MNHKIIKSYNTIIKRTELKHSFFKTDVPVPMPGSAMILSKDIDDIENSLFEISKGSFVKSDIRLGKFKSVYYVDVSQHELEFECDLPSIENLYYFCLKVRMNAKVIKPKDVVIMNITNVCQNVYKHFEKVLSPITRKYYVYQLRELEAVANEAVENSIKIDFLDISDTICDLYLDDRNTLRVASSSIDDLLIIDKGDYINKKNDIINTTWNTKVKITKETMELSEIGAIDKNQASTIINNNFKQLNQDKTLDIPSDELNSEIEEKPLKIDDSESESNL